MLRVCYDIFRNGYYSGQWASFSLKAIEEWVKVRVHVFPCHKYDMSAMVSDIPDVINL